MTRSEALLKLLAVEPETRSRLVVVTGWPTEETVATLEALVTDGRVTYRNGIHGIHGERLYYPTPRHVAALSVSAGASRKRVRNVGGGLVREKRAVASVWAWGQGAQRSGEEE